MSSSEAITEFINYCRRRGLCWGWHQHASLSRTLASSIQKVRPWAWRKCRGPASCAAGLQQAEFVGSLLKFIKLP